MGLIQDVNLTILISQLRVAVTWLAPPLTPVFWSSFSVELHLVE
jgi:hypothetical protein